ncbi:MAG: SpoIIE family protein phosphatase [Treponema sp.]|nr:SpoIIE family protein phosphatase [Treponema sp.]
MNIKNRILVQTLGASLILILVLGTMFFISVAGIRNMALAHSHDLGDSAADISGHTLEVQLTGMINRIAQDMAFILDERLSIIENNSRMAAGQDWSSQSLPQIFDFSQIINSIGIGDSARVFVLNKDGIRVYTSDGTELTPEDGVIKGENFLESSSSHLRSLGLSMTLGATGMTELVMDGLPVYVAYAPIETLGWSLGVAVSVQEVSAMTLSIENQIWQITDNTKAEMDRYMLFSAGIIAVLLILILLGIAVFAIRFTQAITGPILALNKGVHEVSAGNLEREVFVKTGDELEQLAVSFNMMTGQLRKQIEETARATAERQRIDTELDVATRIQMSMLPDNFPPFSGRKNEFELYAQVHPAREVGGDFYDFFFIDDDHFALVVADVSGKGIPAALYMAISKAIIKNHLQSGEAPELAMEIINRQLCDNNIIDMFVTAWLCVLEISTGRLMYINAGHNPPLVKQDDRDFTFLVSPPDLVLAGMEDTRYHNRQLQLKPGDMLFLYTDGIVEAADAQGVFYGRDRLREFLDANTSLPLRDLLNKLRSDMTEFTGGADQSDDITMLAIRICRPQDEGQVITLRSEIESLHSLMSFIGNELDSAGCPRKERGQIELAAEEIFVNIANYAYAGEKDGGDVTVGCRIETEGENTVFKITFSDSGKPFNPLDHIDPDIDQSLEEREAGGLGILIVKKTMDTIQYSHENGLNCLEFSRKWQRRNNDY